jgi:hypothetical protein
MCKWLKSSREAGQALIIALILLALGGLLIVPVLNNSFTNLKQHQRLECKTLNDFSADAGIQYATCKIYNNADSIISTPISENLTINGRTVEINGTYQGGGIFSVNATAYSEGCGKTTIRSFVNLSLGAFTYAVASNSTLSISNSIIDSSPDPGGADIYANGNIGITGVSSLVNGDAFTAGVITQGRDRIAGDITEGADVLQFPGVYSELFADLAQEGGTYNGTLVLDSSQHLGPLYINGSLELKSGANITLDGPVYVTGTIKGTGGHLDGKEHVLSQGNIDMSGGGYGSQSIPVLVSIYGNIRLVGPVVDAVVYAPVGSAEAVNLQLFGAIGGQSVTLSNCILVYSQALHGRTDLPGSELFPLTYIYD